MHWLALSSPSTEALAQGVPDLTAWGWWALRFTPRVASVPLPVPQGSAPGLVMEISASERLFGGRAALVREFLKLNQAAVPVRCAQGATSLIAIGRLMAAPDGAAAQWPAERLPLHVLRAAQPHLPTLGQLGLSRWGQLQALPRGGVARRFGQELLTALDQALGQLPEVYPWLSLPETFGQTLELPQQVDSAPALLFGARRLLTRLHAWLLARQQGVLALRLVWLMDPRKNTATQGDLVLRTAEPTLALAHLQRLLAEHLARVQLAAPVHSLRLESLETAALGGESASLLPGEVRPGDSLHQLIERLAARLGPAQVQRVAPVDDHRPEHMQRLQGVQIAIKSGAGYARLTGVKGLKEGLKSAEKTPPTGLLYPTWLLERPLRLQLQGHRPVYQGPLALLAGPQRLEAGWWDEALPGGLAAGEAGGALALRDYFWARSPRAGLLWIYRERLAAGPASLPAVQATSEAGWYLHGLFA